MRYNTGSIGSKALVLNADYTPICVTSVEEAFKLYYCDKVDLVSTVEGRTLRTVSGHYPFPSVVRLRHYVAKIPFQKVPLTKRNIFRRDEFECQYCGSEKSLTVDHVIPKSKGGEDSWNNWTTACKPCNSAKDNMTLDEAQMTLKRKPMRPNPLIFLKSMGRFDETWKPYLFH